MKNVLSKEEYEALDYHMICAKLYASGLYIQQETNRGDYFVDEQNGCEYSLEEGLSIILDTIVEESLRKYPTWVQTGLYNLFKDRLGVLI